MNPSRAIEDSKAGAGLRLVASMTLVALTSGCILSGKTDRNDRRSSVFPPREERPTPVDEIPEAPSQDLPSSDPSPNDEPPPPLLGQGSYEQVRSLCPGDNEPDVTALGALTVSGNEMIFQFPITAGCTGEQRAVFKEKREGRAERATLSLIWGPVACDGACPEVCPKTLVGELEKDDVWKLERQGEKAHLEAPKNLRSNVCDGKEPLTMVFRDASDRECRPRWEVDSPSGDDQLDILEGQLHWSAPAVSRTRIYTLLHKDLSGDFRIEVDLANFTAGGVGAYFRAFLADSEAIDQFAFAAFDRTASGPGLRVAVVDDGNVVNGTNAQSAQRAQDAGKLILEKKGDQITARAEVEGAAVEITGKLETNRFDLLLQLGSDAASPVTDATSVTVSEVKATGGAAAVADPFDCDTLAR